MNHSLLVIAGVLGMLIALAHGYIGHRKIVMPLESDSAIIRRVNLAVFHLSTLYWFIGGFALTMITNFSDNEARKLVAIVVLCLYLTGAIANFWATRGRHFGWALLTLSSALIVFGLQA